MIYRKGHRITTERFHYVCTYESLCDITKRISHGTKPTATTANLFLGEVDDESFSQNFDLLTRQDVSRYGASKSVHGLTYSEGDVNLPFNLTTSIHSVYSPHSVLILLTSGKPKDPHFD